MTALVAVALELQFLPPLEPSSLFGHLAATAVPGVEEYRNGTFRAAVRLPRGPAILEASLPIADRIPARVWLTDRLDLPEAELRLRRMLDLDADPAAVAAVLGDDPVLAPFVAAVPGRRIAGTPDPAAMAVKTVLGQQVSTAAARTHAARLAAAFGERIRDPESSLTVLFPEPGAIATAGPALEAAARMPASRRATVLALARALDDGRFDPAAGIAAARAALTGIPGIGPWTIETIAMRALGDRDAFLAGDLGVRAAARRLGLPDASGALTRLASRWSPFRSSAVQYLWATGDHAVNVLPDERFRAS